MTTDLVISNWIDNIEAKLVSGELDRAVKLAFSNADAIPNLAIEAVWHLPSIEVLEHSQLQGHLGAYSADKDTIFISHETLQQPAIAIEVLTHELGHAISHRYFNEQTTPHSSYEFTRALLGQDHALILSSGATHEDHEARHPDGGSNLLTVPGSETAIEVEWFETALHIDWAREQLPMLNSQAFDLLKLGQNDSDAFWGPVRIGIFSPYGLQTDSATHFDNNNIRGSIEAMRKRWSNGIERFDDTSISGKLNLPFIDKALVGPGFHGANAGIENLLYRFGQITHAFQDFYSHSNWIEMVNGTRQWIEPGTLLDESLDLPSQLNPGARLNNAPDIAVAMSGPDYDATLVRPFLNWIHWRVEDRQTDWGQAFAQEKSGAQVGGLMTGAVNSAIYYDTNYSVPLIGMQPRQFLSQVEFTKYRGFSHGGLAGEIFGSWMSPLSKDKPDNGRFTDKSLNQTLFDDAQSYSSLQVRHDFDRMGNLIFKSHGIEGLQNFANFAIVASERDLYVQTYSQAGGRWDWDRTDQTLAAAQLFVGAPNEHEGEEDFHFDEANMRFVEVFYRQDDTDFTTHANRSYLTQINIDGQWHDAAEGLINTHHDHSHDYGPASFLPADIQHTSIGGRTLSIAPNWQEGHYLGTVYSVANINTEARVYINHFDVGLDVINIVDAQGSLLETIDIDRADYPETRQYLLENYNIKINARPETEALTHAMVIRSDEVISAGGILTLEASDFFADPDSTHSTTHSPTEGLHSRIRFAGHDETRSWLTLLDDGTLQIADIGQAPQGIHEIYVSLSDEAGLLEGAMITLAIDPVITVAGIGYTPQSELELGFRGTTNSGIGIYAQVVDELGLPVSFIEHLGVQIGDAAGLPADFEAGLITTNLGDPIDHGSMNFFAIYYNSQEVIDLNITQTGQNSFALSNGNEVLADVSITDNPTGTLSTYIDEIYVNGLEDVLLGIPLNTSLVEILSNTADQPHQVSIQTTAYREAYYNGEFGFLVADLQSGHLIDPDSGVKLENVGLTPKNVRDYSVFAIRDVPNTASQTSSSFVLDPDLNLNNLALFPYYQVDTHQGSQLFLGGAAAQRDGVSHIARVEKNTFGVEDLVGGDYDFDDFMVSINSITVTDFV